MKTANAPAFASPLTLACLITLAGCGAGTDDTAGNAGSAASLASETKQATQASVTSTTWAMPTASTTEAAAHSPGTVAGNNPQKQFAAKQLYNSLRTGVATSADGISGAVLAAMFDAWTPRANGMTALATHARGAYGFFGPVADPEVFGLPPVLLHQISRAQHYADGSTATDGSGTAGYAPARGSYLYALRAGASAGDYRQTWAAPHPGFAQLTLALHVQHNVDQDSSRFALPAWIGLEVVETASAGSAGRVSYAQELLHRPPTEFAGDTLIPYDSTLKTWSPPQAGIEGEVRLTLRQGETHQQPILCWELRLPVLHRDLCTRWQVEDGWTPDAALLPDGYDVADYPAGSAGNNETDDATDTPSAEVRNWNTDAALNWDGSPWWWAWE